MGNVTAEDLRRAFAELSAEERAAITGQAPAARGDRPSHKWQHLADAIPDADVAKVVNACRAGIKHAQDHRHDETADGDGWQRLADVAPSLAHAVRARCFSVSHKPLTWGLGRVAEYLQSEEAERRRADRRRRVPPATTAPATSATAEPAAGKGGAK